MTGKHLLVAAAALLLGIGLFVHGRSGGAAPAGASRPPVADNPLTAYRGRTVVLVMGMPGCPGTERATAFFSAYAGETPPQVELLRIDVPPPGGSLGADLAWSAPFKRQVDGDRAVATALEFFSYPTLYVIDREGAIRFTGPCDPAQVKTMVAAIAAEAPGAAKRLYSPPMPAPGAVVEDFTGTTLEGKDIALAGLRGRRATLLFFGTTTCPFSREATLTLPRLAEAYGGKGAAIAIINQGQDAAAIGDAYAGQVLPVIVDADSRISLGRFGVWAVPFFFVLDAQGKVLARQAYTEPAGKAALAQALGLSPGVVLPQAGAG